MGVGVGGGDSSSPLIYFLNSLSVIPPFLFIPIVHGQLLSSVQTNLPCVPKMWVKNLYRTFSLSSAVTLVGSWKCGGTHSPAALLPNIPVQASEDFATDLLTIEGGDCRMPLPACRPRASCSR